MGYIEKQLLKAPLLVHIYNRIKRLEKDTNGVVCLQFAIHPEGLSMVVRIYLPASEKEYPFFDVIMPSEIGNQLKENERIDILFDAIAEALNKVQPISSMSGGLIHH